MEHSEFRIGLEFWCNDRRWRITDVGTRVVVAIFVDEPQMTTAYPDGRRTTRKLTTEEAEQIGWFNGPPYGVPERVFDEDDREICTLTKEKQP